MITEIQYAPAAGAEACLEGAEFRGVAADGTRTLLHEVARRASPGDAAPAGVG